MRRSISIIAAMAVAAPVAAASPLAIQAETQLRNRQHEEHRREDRPRREQRQQRRDLNGKDGWHHGGAWGHPPHHDRGGWHDAWESSSSSSSSSSGKSGKSGGGSGKSGKSGGSSSSSSSSSGDDMKEGWHGGWGGKPGWGHGHHGWYTSSSSSSGSGKSGKSGGGSKGSKGSSSGSSSSHDGWGHGWNHHHHGNHHNHHDEGWHGAWWAGSGSSSSSSGKSGKSGGGSKSGKGSSSSSSSEDHSHGPWHNSWSYKPWRPWSSGSSSSSSSKSGKSDKSGKGSKSSSSSSSSTSGDWYFYLHSHPHSHGPKKSSSSSTTSVDYVPPDSSSPGICAPAHDRGGLECDRDDEWDYCTEPGEEAECGSGRACYDKELCPEFALGAKHPVGVCDAHGKGLDCDEVTTYCTEPGGHGECGHERRCHDAGLCGHGPGGDYDGVCGLALHGGKHSGLDCDEVATKCTEPGGTAECAYGARCFDADLCRDGDHAGFCGGGGGGGKFDCDDISTYCARPGEGGQCPHGRRCLDLDVCAPTLPPVKEATEPPTPSPTVLALNEVCFIEGKIVDCGEWASSWGGDGYGGGWDADGHGSGDGWATDGHDDGDGEGDGSAWNDDGHGGDGSGDGKGHGEVITVPFTYTVDTDGKVDPESAVKPMENAILDDVADYIDENEEFGHFTGKITAAPEDEIADDDWCGDGHAVRCSVVNGEMSVIVGSWDGDGHDFDECEVLKVIKESMEGRDYSEDVDGVSGAKYRNSDVDCGKIIGGAQIVVPPEDDDLSVGAAFGMLAAMAALLALLFLLASKFKRKPKPPPLELEPVRDDISLISNSLNGSAYGDSFDPYANTVDVHKCTSIYCDCNKGVGGTTFLPAPRKVDMAKTMMANGISPTAVDQVDGEFFNRDEDDSEIDQASELEQQDESVFDQASDIEQQSGQVSAQTRGSIMRVPIRSQLEDQDRPLTPVNEIAHDSEIDTELESVAGDNDYSTVPPPPPPLSDHPAYGQGSGEVQATESNDEISI